jgi:aspartokinase-like uncharacterized kinase
MSQRGVNVVKVGGSLLGWPELGPRLRAWLAGRRGRHVLIAGGGELCDVIRRLDRTYALGQERCHWLCVDLLATTARILACVLKEVPLATSLADVGATRGASGENPSAVILDPRPFVFDEHRQTQGIALPTSWSVTSDSIAAAVARRLAAQELVLLKSCDPPAESIALAAAAGFVDAHFPIAAQGLPRTCCVNLKAGYQAVELRQS